MGMFFFKDGYGATFEITKRCNLKCTYCYADSDEDAVDLPTDEWKRIIDRADELGIKYLLFSGGEPTLRSDLLDLLRYADSLSMVTALRSNGTLLTDSIIAEIASLKHLSSFCLSLDGATLKQNDYLRGQGSFLAVFGAARLLKEAGVPTYIETTFSKANIGQSEYFAVIANALGLDGLVVRQVVREGRASERDEDCLFSKEDVSVLTKLRDEFAPQYSINVHFACVLGEPSICSRMINVRYDGKISYCYLKREPLANSIFDIDKETIKRVLNCDLRS